MKITCIDKEMKTVLESGFYKIPRFQRPYLWEKEQVEDFWTDAIASTEPEYFIGSMVVFGPINETFGVVDGQQRLTTVSMILAAIRNKLNAENEELLAKGLHRLVERPDINFADQFVIQTETSYPYLQEKIQKFGEPDVDDIEAGQEEERLQRAFDLITSFVDDAVNSVKANMTIPAKDRQNEIRKSLLTLRDRVLGLKLIFVELDNEDDAYLIFETLNTRGKDLSVSDLVKNHLTRLIKPTNANVDLARDRWNKIVETLEGSQEDLKLNSFLLHLWLSEHEFTTEKKLFKAIRSSVRKDNAKAYLKKLGAEAATYRQIQETSYWKWKKEEVDIKGSLDALAVFRVKLQIPFLMAVMRDYKAGNIKKKHAEDILRAVENFHFMFTSVTSQRSSGGISQMYALHARQLLAAPDLPAKQTCLNELKVKLRDKKPSFAEFETDFMAIGFTNDFTKQKKLVQYILARIDEWSSKGVHIDYERMSIEHIASQNPGKAGVSAKSVGMIGNLILVDAETNGKLANKDFAAKLKILSSTHVYLDDHIKQATNWTDKEIELRTRTLAKLAYEKIWKL